MRFLIITLAIGVVALICTVNTAPARVQSPGSIISSAEIQSDEIQEAFFKAFANLGTAVLKKLTDDSEMVQSQKAEAQFWGTFGPMILRGVGSYLANKIIDGEVAKAELWRGLPLTG